MAAVSETASSCSSTSATMDVKGSDGGAEYGMGGHSPATHSQAGAEFGGRDDAYCYGPAPGACFCRMNLYAHTCLREPCGARNRR